MLDGNKFIRKINESPDGNQHLHGLGVVVAGLIDGVNPCAISMILFFLTFVQVQNRKRTFLIGFLFILGTFISYFLLGTVLFKLISRINIPLIRLLIRYFMLIFVIVLIILNLKDYYSAKGLKYGKIILQLPPYLRRLSHRIIKQLSTTSSNTKVMAILAFITGILISLTEFLCTAQIYLPTIVSIIQLSGNVSLTLKAIIMLLIYNIGFITPLLIILTTICIGAKVLDLSEVVRKHLPKIKLINALFFTIILILLLIT